MKITKEDANKSAILRRHFESGSGRCKYLQQEGVHFAYY